MNNSSSLVMHVANPLGARARHFVELSLATRRGVHGAAFATKHPHLVRVDYDPRLVSSLDIVRQVRNQNLDAERVS